MWWYVMAGTYWQVMACKARNAMACFMPCNAMVYAASRACTRSPIHFVLHDAYLVFRRGTFFFVGITYSPYQILSFAFSSKRRWPKDGLQRMRPWRLPEACRFLGGFETCTKFITPNSLLLRIVVHADCDHKGDCKTVNWTSIFDMEGFRHCIVSGISEALIWLSTPWLCSSFDFTCQSAYLACLGLNLDPHISRLWRQFCPFSAGSSSLWCLEMRGACVAWTDYHGSELQRFKGWCKNHGGWNSPTRSSQRTGCKTKNPKSPSDLNVDLVCFGWGM